MTYFHFTHIGHLPRILAAGMLLPTESNVGSPTSIYPPVGMGVGPDVVWLMDTPEVGDASGDMHHGLYPEKRRVRIEVDVKAIRWRDWSFTAQMHPEWRETLVNAAGGWEVAEHWFILPAPIRRKRWVSIHDMVEDTPIEFANE